VTSPDPSAPAPEPAADEADGATPAAEAATRRSRRRRLSRRVVVVAAAAAAAVIALVVVLVVQSNNGPRDPIVTVTITEQGTLPTPPTDPIERETSTALQAALPDAVLGYAVSDQVESEAMAELSALEGWQLTYTGADDEILLEVGQWPDNREAERAYDAVVGDAEPIAEGDVVVDGDTVGTFVVQEIDDGTERTLWRNGTALFVASGPSGTTQTFYDAFGL